VVVPPLKKSHIGAQDSGGTEANTTTKGGMPRYEPFRDASARTVPHVIVPIRDQAAEHSKSR
jgi:hypothetical protein